MCTSISFSTVSFTEWATHQINTSCFLNPSAYKLRPIEDKGCIEDSLKASNIDLFDRTVIPIQLSQYLPILIKKAVRIAVISLRFLGTPFAIAYKSSLLVKHSYSLFFESEEAENTKKKILTLAKAILSDCMELLLVTLLVPIVALTLFVITMPNGVIFSETAIKSILVASTIIAGNSVYASLNLNANDQYGYEKALFLRDEFGITDLTGRPLSWDRKKDQDIHFYDPISNQELSPAECVHIIKEYTKRPLSFINKDRFYLKYSGYFYDLANKEYQKFFSIFTTIQSQIPQEKSELFSKQNKKLTAKSFILFLKQHQSEIGFSDEDIKTFGSQLTSTENNRKKLLEFTENTYENLLRSSQDLGNGKTRTTRMKFSSLL